VGGKNDETRNKEEDLQGRRTRNNGNRNYKQDLIAAHNVLGVVIVIPEVVVVTQNKLLIIFGCNLEKAFENT